jgi:4-amino-4-deoxy-L-arabinose transferase-like glycosyltransferase
MFQRFDHRVFHYLLLAVVWAVLCLPNLGAPSLWDIDEGNNATCSDAMYESGNWVVPTFNNHLRFDKPALLYWLQLAAYNVFGVNEFAARFPSALAALVAVLATYELGRRAFHARVGLLAGLIVASTVAFCASAHFANPDAVLNACTALTLVLFYTGYRRGGGWWSLATGVTTALGVLAKGPVGVVLPSAVLILFLMWERQLRRLWDWRMLAGVLAFLVVAAPWYVWVSLETKGQWLKEFFFTHNVDRWRSPMENHGGPLLYYVLMLILGFLPWSIFFGLASWNAFRELRPNVGQMKAGRSLLRQILAWLAMFYGALQRGGRGRRLVRSILAWLAGHWSRPTENPNLSAVRFLVCWFGVYFVFFSLSGTKLPNYILPLYPAVAVLMARVLDRYRLGAIHPAGWVLRLSLVSLGMVGIGFVAIALVAGEVVPLDVLRGRYLPGLEMLAVAGIILLGGAALAWRYARTNRRANLLALLTTTSVLFTAAVAALGPILVDRSKAPRELVRLLPANQTHREVRVGAYGYFQPSLVFYCQREVAILEGEQQVQDFLDGPLPSYLILPAERWAELQPKLGGLGNRCHPLGSKYDLYQGGDIVVVSNEAPPLARQE